MHNNLPPGVTEANPVFTYNDLGEKECDECLGTGQVPEEMMDWDEMDVQINFYKCWKCEGKCTIPKTEDDILNAREARKENNSEL